MKHLLFFLSLFFLVQSCDERCGNSICTDNYVTIAVEVVDPNGIPILLDSTRINQGPVLVPEDFGVSGYYPLASDSDIREINRKGTPFHIKGWLNAELVLDEDFLIGKDCCHIQKLEGVDKVIVD